MEKPMVGDVVELLSAGGQSGIVMQIVSVDTVLVSWDGDEVYQREKIKELCLLYREEAYQEILASMC